MKPRYLLLVVLALLVRDSGSVSAQTCGYRAHVWVTQYLPYITPNNYVTVEFDDLGVPLLDFTSAANRVTYLAKEGVWWAAPTTPPKTLYYPPHMIQFMELRYYCQ